MTQIDINFFFEKNQKLRFMFIDDDGGDSDDPYYDLIGTFEIYLGQIMSAKGQTVTRPLTIPGERKQRGMAIVSAESVKESNYTVQFTMTTKNTPCKGPFMFGLYKAYTKTWFEIQRAKP